MYNNLNNSFYDEGVRNTKSNNNNELNYNNDLSASLTFKSIRLESPVSILRKKIAFISLDPFFVLYYSFEYIRL